MKATVAETKIRAARAAVTMPGSLCMIMVAIMPVTQSSKMTKVPPSPWSNPSIPIRRTGSPPLPSIGARLSRTNDATAASAPKRPP